MQAGQVVAASPTHTLEARSQQYINSFFPHRESRSFRVPMSVRPLTHVISLPQQPGVLKINPDAVTLPPARTDGSLSGHQPPPVPLKLGLRHGHLHIEIPRRLFSLIKKGQIR